MLGGNRGKLFAALTGFVLAFLAVAIPLAIWDLSATYTLNHVEAEHYSEQYQASASERIADDCGMAEPAAIAHCVEQVVTATHEQQRAEADLNAQRDMANYARGALIIAAMGVGVTAIGVVYVALTLSEARKTTTAALQGAAAAIEANNTAKDIGKKQLRPYIVYNSAKFDKLWISPSQARLQVDVSFRNCGLSPGVITAASRAVYAPRGKGKWDQAGAGWQRHRILIGPEQTERVIFDAIESDPDGNFSWFSIGILLWYEDLFGNRYDDEHVWLIFDGRSFRQIFDHGFSLYRPEKE